MNKQKEPTVQLFLKELFGDPSQFKPKKTFYEKTGINQKRWGAIYREDESPTISELNAIAKYFGKTLKMITEKRQYSLFD